jgi:Zn-dependent protease with chaperone function
MTQVRNVLDALGIGLGIEPPTLKVLDDDAPNALSARRRDERIICVTTGLAGFPRDEIEAVCAHELLHVSAPDARVVGAAFLTTIRARNTALTAIVAGLLMATGAVGALKYDLVLPTLFLVGAGLTAVAAVAYGALSKPLESLRRQSDEVADVGAVMLAKNPMALAQVLDRLVIDERRVATTNDRCGHQWFEACEEILTSAETEDGRTKRAEAIAAANAAIVKELERRSALATATAAGIAR